MAKINFEYVKHPDGYSVKCEILTDFQRPGFYRCSIFLGEDIDVRKDKPWITGTAHHCKSHMVAFDQAFRYARKKICKV